MFEGQGEGSKPPSELGRVIPPVLLPTFSRNHPSSDNVPSVAPSDAIGGEFQTPFTSDDEGSCPIRANVGLPLTPTLESPAASPPARYSPEYFMSEIFDRINNILTKINIDRSLKKANKELIIQSAKEIKPLVENLCFIMQTPAKTTQADGAPVVQCGHVDMPTINVIKDTIKEEIRSEFAKALPKVTTNKMTFSAVAAMPPRRDTPPKKSIPVTKPALIVAASKTTTSSAETHQVFRQAVSFRKTGFTPAGVKYVSNNKLRVEFDSPEHREVALGLIRSKPECAVTAEVSRSLKPMVILKGISRDTPPEELVEIMLSQNQAIRQAASGIDDIKFKFKRANKNRNLYNAVLIMTPETWKAVIDAGRVNVDHQRVYADNYVPLLQCFKCLQFGHIRKYCKQEQSICSHCAAPEHEFRDCPVKNQPEKAKCHNCVSFNMKNNLKKSTVHSATSASCPRVSQMRTTTENITDYGLRAC